MKSRYAPIAVFAYKRLSHLQETVKALLANPESAESDLYVFSDAPRDEKDASEVAQVREWISGIQGFKSTQIILREKNLGLSTSLLSGVDKILESHDRVIVVEDDIVSSPKFLKFMNEGLEAFENAPQVSSISGYLYPLKKLPSGPFFLDFPECWGWATWKRAWDKFQRDPATLFQTIKSQKRGHEFNFQGSYPYLEMLEAQIRGDGKSWAVRWAAHCFLNKELTLYPPQSLVQNIGFDGSGENCGNLTNYDTDTFQGEWPDLRSLTPNNNLLMRRAFQEYFLATIPQVKASWKTKLKRFLGVGSP